MEKEEEIFGFELARGRFDTYLWTFDTENMEVNDEMILKCFCFFIIKWISSAAVN